MEKINILLSVIFLLLTFNIKAQLNPAKAADKNNNKKEIEFSFFLGSSFGGPFNDINTSVNETVFHGQSGNQNGFSAVSSTRRGLPVRFDFKYNISQKSGISLSRGSLDAFSIRIDGYTPTIKSKLKSTSLDYVYSLGHNKHEFSTGISFISQKIEPDISDIIITGKAKVQKVGINFGYAYHFIERRGFFMAFNTQYNWGGTAVIGPYKIYEPARHYDIFGWGIIEDTVPSRTTTYVRTLVHLDSFNIGFSMGFRFGQEADVTMNKISWL